MCYSLKVVSFNVFCGRFPPRSPYIKEKIYYENPDIIGFQEVTPDIRDWLLQSFPNYNIIGCGRTEDYLGEYNTIMYKRNILELFGLNVFWLSPTPYIPGSRYEEQSSCPRICNVATFRLYSGGKPFRFYNTHLDHVGEKARVLGMNQILKQIKNDNEFIEYPFILTGDLNAQPDSETLANIHNFKDFPLKDISSDLKVTYHDYGKSSVKIDYIFTSGDLKTSPAVIWDDCKDGNYLSDHYPVCADIII